MNQPPPVESREIIRPVDGRTILILRGSSEAVAHAANAQLEREPGKWRISYQFFNYGNEQAYVELEMTH